MHKASTVTTAVYLLYAYTRNLPEISRPQAVGLFRGAGSRYSTADTDTADTADTELLCQLLSAVYPRLPPIMFFTGKEIHRKISV